MDSIKIVVISLLIISLVGLIDSVYLTYKHYSGASPGCVIQKGCDRVTTSVYATVAGIPVALLGVGYYGLIFGLSLVQYKIALALTPLGFIASAWFVYLQLFIIGALCLYCIISASASTLLFGTAIYYWLKKYNKY